MFAHLKPTKEDEEGDLRKSEARAAKNAAGVASPSATAQPGPKTAAPSEPPVVALEAEPAEDELF